MKHRLFTLGWAALLAPAVISSAAPATGPIVAQRADRDLSTPGLLFPVGTPRSAILQQMGAPDERLSANAWVYWHHTTNRPDLSKGYDTLVIVFEADRVSFMKIVAGTEIRQLVAALEKHRANLDPASLLAAQTPAKK